MSRRLAGRGGRIGHFRGGPLAGALTVSQLHEPAGLTVITNQDGSTVDFGSLDGHTWTETSKWTNTTYTQVVADASNPKGSGFAIQKNWYTGDATDSGNGLITLQHFPAVVTTLYVRYRLYWSSNFAQTAVLNGHKFGYWGAQGHTGSPTQYYCTNGGGGASPWRLGWFDQVNSPRPSQYATNYDLTLAAWHTIEVLHEAQSAVGAADGRVRVWTDNVLDIDLPNATFVQSADSPVDVGLDGLQLFFIRGTVGNTFDRDDYLRLGELYVSGA